MLIILNLYTSTTSGINVCQWLAMGKNQVIDNDRDMNQQWRQKDRLVC